MNNGCTCSSSPCCCGPVQPPACNCPPSPIPPWERQSQSPLIQMLVDSTIPQITLDPDVTYLNQAQNQSAPINNALVLPSGNYLKQIKRIYIPAAAIATTATWTVSGAFSGGYTKLVFNTIGYGAMLEWDGSGWQLTGGNAALVA